MTETRTPTPITGEVPCTYHPDTMTGLRCGRCFKPICPKCGVRTPVGLRCPECAGVRTNVAVKADPASNIVAICVGLLVGVVVGVLWGYFPKWEFYWALLLGFGVAESMVRFVKYRHGIDLQIAGMVAVAIGLVISRYFILDRLGLSFGDIGDLTDFGRQQAQLQIMPDAIYALVAILIPFIRFR